MAPGAAFPDFAGPKPPGSDPVLAVALDLPTAGEALALATRLNHLPLWMKVGLELFTAEGPALVKALCEMRFAVFLDLKYHDIPNTVRGAVRSASGLGARMLTLHAAGGLAMCREAVNGREEAGLPPDEGPLLMGVTVLTSAKGPAGAMLDRVVELALTAKEAGLDGVVCSGREASAVKRACGDEFLCLCPGIRPVGGACDDQARVCSPEEAVRAGADFLVMGRAVTRAGDPALAAAEALENMRDGLVGRLSAPRPLTDL
ncbi:MAG: orotidine-5'-phosphate decarboxylase [Desulfovibrio sp.]|jgi:orotidine-5'-phosphate decarboxylase|nr:orotidine-5'-phosphate decarboxylase [Desulfovibrio sp.]